MLGALTSSNVFMLGLWHFAIDAIALFMLATAGVITIAALARIKSRKERDSAIETHSGEFTVAPGSASCEIAVCHAMLNDVTNFTVKWDEEECEIVPCDCDDGSGDKIEGDLIQLGRELILIIKWSTSRTRSGHWSVTRKTFVQGGERHHHHKGR